MVHDFADNSSKGPNRRPKRPKSKTSQSGDKPRQRQQEPILGQQSLDRKNRLFSPLVFVGGTIILLLGLTCVKSLLHIASKHHQAAKSPVQHSSHQAKAKQPNQQADHSTSNDYQFYSMLSNLKLETAPTQKVESFEKYANRFSYLLQVATTRKQSAAEQITEKLALLGLEGRMEQVEVNGQTWWRVKLGPFYSLKKAEATEQILESNRISYLRLTHKKNR